MGELQKLPNIGEKLEKQLNDIGITTAEQLKKVGSCSAWAKILENDSSACMLRLGALEGAIEGIRRTELSDEKKAELKAFYKKAKGK